jgi:2-polyprenyl-3-methyl-5-hydroxy-6-metoxy-1,4-benzoquinol methylase
MKNCLICESVNLKDIYNGKIRSGSAGKFSKDNYKVFKCLDCNVKFLDKFLNPDFYISSEYRDSYNDSSKVETYHQIHDENETEKINKISLDILRNKKVADFGAGGGTFLNVVSSVAKGTYAIEPSTFFHHELGLKHKVFSYGSELLNSGVKVDIATSFDVLEHVENPKVYLEEINSSLVKGGTMYLMTPNYNEILNDFSIKEFDEFNFRTAHYYYFCEKSIENLLISAGFSDFKIGFHHKYDISNLIFWLKDKKPTGKNKYDLFDYQFNSFYKNYLINKGKTSHLWIKAIK